MTRDEIFMARALQLASFGAGHVSPNPMVGAVIVSPDGKIIGEGFHRKYGEFHAEVNAINSVLPELENQIGHSTMYVTLEPCSHWGKTPPCANLLCEKKLKRVVIGSRDPNPKVSGRGIKLLEESGIEVTTGCLEKECQELNQRFFTAHTLKRPWIILKWAETSEGALCNPDGSPLMISNSVTLSLMHAERAKCDAIMVGTNTLMNDNPSLTTRYWPGNSPRPVIFESEKINHKQNDYKIFDRNPIILNPRINLKENMEILFRDYGITSLMVEGGKKLLTSFIETGLYDKIRIEKKID